MSRAMILTLAVGLSFFTATNPEYNFPGVVEFAVLGVAGVLYATSPETQLNRRGKFLAWCLAMLFAVLIGRYLLGLRTNAIARACLHLFAPVGGVECLLQQTNMGNTGLRQLLFHETAAAIFFAASQIGARCWKSASTIVLGVLAALAVPALYQVSSFYFDIDHSLVTDSFVSGGAMWSVHRGTAVAANPGWLWPIMMPCLAVALGFCLKGAGGAKRAVSGALALLFALAIFTCQQRGGYLIVFSLPLVAVACSIFANRSFSPSRKAQAIVLVLAAIGALQVFYGLDSAAIWLGGKIGMPVRDHVLTLDRNRWAIWQAAFDGMQGRWLSGYGYQTWVREFSPLVAASGRPELAFDTAHNLVVQLIFELGVVHALAILGVILAFVVSFIRKPQATLSAGRLGGLLVFFGALVTTFVQELDYINTSYYLFALLLGLMFGFERTLHSDAPLGRAQLAGARRSRMRFALVLASVLALGISCLFWRQFSWGGYGFEWRLSSSAGGNERWFRPWGAITAFSNKAALRYSVFNFKDSGGYDGLPREGVNDLTNFAFNSNGLLVRAGRRWWGRQIMYKFPVQRKIDQRLIAFRMDVMPLATSIGLFYAKGAYSWEPGPDGKGAEFWCEQNCLLLVRRDDSCAKPVLSIGSPRPDVTSSAPLQVTTQIASVTEKIYNEWHAHLDPQVPLAIGFKSNALADHITKRQGAIADPRGTMEVDLESADQTWGWLIDVTADRTYNPQQLGVSGDTRTLGARVVDLRCRS